MPPIRQRIARDRVRASISAVLSIRSGCGTAGFPAAPSSYFLGLVRDMAVSARPRIEMTRDRTSILVSLFIGSLGAVGSIRLPCADE
mgnify:CR=1 FL=1